MTSESSSWNTKQSDFLNIQHTHRALFFSLIDEVWEYKYKTSDEWALKKSFSAFSCFWFFFFVFPSPFTPITLPLRSSFLNIFHSTWKYPEPLYFVCYVSYFSLFFIRFGFVVNGKKARDQNLLFHLLALKCVTKVTKIKFIPIRQWKSRKDFTNMCVGWSINWRWHDMVDVAKSYTSTSVKH